MTDKITINRIVAFCFIIFISFWCVKGRMFARIGSLLECIVDDYAAGSPAVTLTDLESQVSSAMYKRSAWLDLGGLALKETGARSTYNDENIYITKDSYIVSKRQDTTTDYEFSQIVSFREFLDANGISFLYVNEPDKYLDDTLFEREFGVRSYSNRNMDRLLARLREENIPVLDLRDEIRSGNLNIRDMFFRTDHHWTPEAGLWAAGRIAGAMNRYCGYRIDTTLYDPQNYTNKEWKACWLGEQGRKVGRTLVGLDDYKNAVPAFPTELVIVEQDGSSKEGSFLDLIDESTYNTQQDLYFGDSWHYSYRTAHCINKLQPEGKVLLLGESYDYVTEPFLALGVHEIEFLCLRYTGDLNLREYISDHDFDTVIVCYEQPVLGAHDNPDSSNYRMYQFD